MPGIGGGGGGLAAETLQYGIAAFNFDDLSNNTYTTSGFPVTSKVLQNKAAGPNSPTNPTIGLTQSIVTPPSGTFFSTPTTKWGSGNMVGMRAEDSAQEIMLGGLTTLGWGAAAFTPGRTLTTYNISSMWQFDMWFYTSYSSSGVIWPFGVDHLGLFSVGGNGTGTVLFDFRIGNSSIQVYNGPAQAININYGAPAIPAGWNLLTISVDSGRNARCFINGTQRGSAGLVPGADTAIPNNGAAVGFFKQFYDEIGSGSQFYYIDSMRMLVGKAQTTNFTPYTEPFI